MKIEKVLIKNINSLQGEQEINFLAAPFRDTGLFAITGDTGSGKTTILDAITLALYGKVHRNKEVREVLSYGSTDCFAEVEFSVKSKKYRARWDVHRARNKIEGAIQDSHREISSWNAEQEVYEIISSKKREVDKAIENISGLDFDRFCRSVLLSQGDFAAFLKANEKERSDLLERITGTEIYSQISQAAFQKHKEEREKLEAFQQQQANLRLLEKEEVKEKKTAKKELEKESKALQKELAQLRSQLQWWQQIKELQEKEKKLEEGLAQLALQKTQKQAAFHALEQHQKISPFAPLLLQTGEQQSKLSLQQTELKESEAQIARLANRQSKGKSVYQQSIEALEQAKKDDKLAVKKIGATQKLDVKIAEKKQALIIPEEEKALKDQQLKSDRSTLQKIQKQQETFQQQAQDLSIWLQQNEAQQLINDLGEIKPLLNNLQQIEKKGSAYKEELEQEKLALKKEGKALDTLEKKKDKQRDRQNNLLNNFEAKAPEQFASKPQEMIRLLSNEIEDLSEQRNNLLQFNTLYDQYHSLLREQLQYEEKLENLRSHESHLNNEVLTSLELVDAISERLEFKKQIYEQQQLIANYERDRSALQPNSPCPVCQSTDHPFRHQHFKPFLSQAQKEYKTVQRQYDDLMAHYRKTLLKQDRLAQEIELLAGTEGRELGGQVQQQLEKILEYETKIATIIPILPQQNLVESGSRKLQEEIFKFESSLVQKKKQKNQLTKLHDQIAEGEKSLQKLEEQCKDQQRETDKRQERIHFIEEKKAERQSQYQLTLEEINTILGKYDLKYDRKKSGEQIEQLQQKQLLWKQKDKALTEARQKIKLGEQKIEQQNKQIQAEKKNFKKLQTQINLNKEQLKKIQAERFTLLEDRDPDEERSRQEAILQNFAQQKDLQQKTLEDIGAQLKEIQGQEKNQRKVFEKGTKEFDQNQAKLLSQIIKAGFESIKEIRAMYLEEEEVQKLEAEKQALEKSHLQQNQSLADAKKDLKKLIASLKDHPEQEALHTLQHQQDQRYQEVIRHIGGIDTELKYQKTLEAEARQLLQQISGQRKEYNRWARLSDLIGSADGKKFRVFAQGLTLKKLCLLANKHLHNLDGRYWIEKRGDQDLELDIIDTYQAGNRRSMNTLSGGESFLVSLALALGLSDLAGRNTNIQSLFIDEGFGTLDDASLDMAITTLENLQADGKTIGVISHVKELKERISTQIQLIKEGNGRSRIQILG